MPYDNVPKALWPKMERCVAKQKKAGKSVKSAHAICYSSIVGKGVSEAAKRKKGG